MRASGRRSIDRKRELDIALLSDAGVVLSQSTKVNDSVVTNILMYGVKPMWFPNYIFEEAVVGFII
jgi:hypothetical protein